ncbi:MAG: methionine adenosyltransferase [Nitrososphaerales archaeon]
MQKRAIHVEQLTCEAVSDLEVEIVERKGKGHPDSLIDGASEAVSRALCKYYLDEYGRIFHHNVDKGLLVGGRSNPRFGGGEVVEPIFIMVAGRVVSRIKQDGEVRDVPIGVLATSAMNDFLKSTLRYLDVEEDVNVEYKLKQGSSDLTAIFDSSRSIPLGNDTSIGIGFAPLTSTEKIVLETEHMLNSPSLKKELPEVGEDIKVMGLRRNRTVNLTVASAMISRLIPDASHYLSVVGEIQRRVKDMASKITDLDVDVQVNAGDDPSKGVFYLTVTGTSAEAGDDGNTGRGNRQNGLITAMRQYSMEACAGKNPVNHTGKLYNVLAQKAADEIVAEVKGIKEVYVRLLSRIGSPIDQPQVCSSAVVLEEGVALSDVEGDITSILDGELADITSITPLIIGGKVTLF